MAGTFRDEFVGAVRNAFCTALQLQRNYYGYVGRNPFFITARLAEQFFDVSYRLFCNMEPPPKPDPPFTGGQCPVAYIVNCTLNFQFQDGASITPTNLTGTAGGPIARFYLRTSPPPFANADVMAVRAGDGTEFRIGGAGSGSLSNPIGSETSFVINTITRVDGLPDDCGDPPPEVPEPEPGYNQPDAPFTYSPDGGGDINIPLIFIFAPVRVNLRGELTVPIRINLGGINPEFNGDINLNNGDININFGNPNYSRDGLPNPDGYEAPTDSPDVPPDVPVDVPNPPPTSNDDDTTRLLRACIVTVTSVPDDITEIFQDDNPNIYLPGFGNIQFAINVGGTIAWTSHINVYNKRNFIAVDWEGGANAVRGTPRPGVTWTITPIYALVEDAVEFA